MLFRHRTSRRWTFFLASLSGSVAALVWLLISSALMIGPGSSRNFSGPVSGRIGLGQPGRFRLAIMSDVHNNVVGLERVTADAAAEGADAALILGDFTHRGLMIEKRLFLIRSAGDRLGLPVFTIIGNHDLDHGRHTGHDYRRLFGDDHYWWRFGNNLFIAINNVEPERRQQEREWLQSVLDRQARPEDSVFLLAHKPLVDYEAEVVKWSGAIGRTLAAAVGPGKGFILSGHLHQRHEAMIDGVRVFSVANVGDFDDRDSRVELEYLMLDCDSHRCEVARHGLGESQARSSLASLLLVDGYYFWPAWSGASLSLTGLAAGLSHHRRRREKAIAPKSAPDLAPSLPSLFQ